MPYPALVAATGGRLVAANAATDLLTTGAAAELLDPPVNALRLMVHPDGLAPRVENLAEWGRHIIENVRAHALRSPDPRLDQLLAELERYVPAAPPGPDHLGFAVPLRLRCEEGQVRLITTLASFATTLDVTLGELHLEAYVPADEPTARILNERRRRAGAESVGSFPPELSWERDHLPARRRFNWAARGSVALSEDADPRRMARCVSSHSSAAAVLRGAIVTRRC